MAAPDREDPAPAPAVNGSLDGRGAASVPFSATIAVIGSLERAESSSEPLSADPAARFTTATRMWGREMDSQLRGNVSAAVFNPRRRHEG
jgi:hypothetical protein